MALASARINRAVTSSVAERATEVRARARDLSSAYARDPFKHLEDGHVVVLDLETLRPTLLDPWEHQLDLAADWIDLDYLAQTGRLRWRNVHEIKSRKMGVTWFVAYLYVWALRWHPVRGLALSLKVDEIADSGLTTDSFFGRLKFIAEYQDREEDEPVGGWPDNLRPRFTYTGGNAPRVGGQAGGFLAGVGAIPDPGRTGIFDSMFLDEFARVPFGKQAQASLTRACPSGRLYNSTVKGEDNEFWRIREAKPKGYTFRRDHWSSHTLYGRGAHVAAALDDDGKVATAGKRGCAECDAIKAGLRWTAAEPVAHRFPGKLTSPWYDEAVLDLTDDQVAAELDIDPAAALTARVYPEFSEERHLAAIEIPRMASVPIELGWDYGFGTTSIVIAQDTPREYRIIGEVEMHDSLPEEDARALLSELRALGLNEAELQPEVLRHVLMVGDPAGEGTEKTTGRSLASEYNRRFGFNIVSKGSGIWPTVRSVKRMLNGRPKEIVVSQRCPLFAYHMKHNRWPTDRQGNPKPDPAEPVNDEHNHMMRATAYLVSWKYPIPDVERSIRRATERVEESGRLDEGVSYEMSL